VQKTPANILLVEASFGDELFEPDPQLQQNVHVVHLQCTAVPWQKERLLNVAIQNLPPYVEKVAWLDADVILENRDWIQEASLQLEILPVVQLFDSVVHLPRGDVTFNGDGICRRSFAPESTAFSVNGQLDWSSHGLTGFAWAARRTLLDTCGFFDLCLFGDHLMAHGFLGDWRSPCIDLLIGLDTVINDEYRQWAQMACRQSGKQIGLVRGRVLHIWHGDYKNCKYYESAQRLKGLRFVPARDLRVSGNGTWEWTGTNAGLEKCAADLFPQRKEDGSTHPITSPSHIADCCPQ
jgi:hypothetical protein